jgi:SnoaL-like domain
MNKICQVLRRISAWQLPNQKQIKMNTTTFITRERPASRLFAPVELLQTVFAALNERNIRRVIDQFADDFTFSDYALGLEFTDKKGLTEFFQKSFTLFRDTGVELVSAFECDDHAIAEWKLTGMQIEQFGSRSYRFPISLSGSTIVQEKHGRIVRWSDYYDKLTSRRGPLKAFFEEWIEY